MLFQKLIRNKKSEELNVENLPFWILVIIVIAIIGFAIYGGTKVAFEKKLDTHEIEHFIWTERILDALAYEDSGRKYSGIIDYNKFNNMTLTDALVLPFEKRNDKFVFKVILKDIDLVKIDEIYSDKELYEDAAPLIRLKYLQNTEIRYVLLRKNNKFKKAKIEIIELYPKK